MRYRGVFKGVQSVFLIISVIIILSVTIGISRFWIHKERAEPERIVEAIENACIQCYALEGSYPPSLQYLKEHYGIILDNERYFYYYEIFASNIMPCVEVYEKGL